MPRISFVLVVYREQAFLRECLTSVLSQAPSDVEVIVVDDASPDHGPAILDELAASDDRLKIHHLDEWVGVGEARNLALDMASGDYLWFIETTDRLPRGAVTAVMDRLRQAQPEVLLVNHTVTDWAGVTKPNPYEDALTGAKASASYTLDKRPALADLADVVWNKIIRRDYLGDLGVRFGPGGDAELSLTYPAMLAAESISLLDRVCYERREPRNAVRERRVHGSPFDAFAQYDEVFRFADSCGERTAERRALVVTSMLRHYIASLDVLPEGERPEFFRKVAQSYRDHARGDEPAPPGRLLQLQFSLVKRGSYDAYRTLGWVAERRHGVRRRQEKLTQRGRRRVATVRRRKLERYYRSQRRQPIDESLAVFAAYWYRGYACNPRAIYEKAREMVPWLRGVWVVEADAVEAMPEGVPYVVAGTREYYQTLATAKYFVNNVNFPNHVVKRPGQVHVQTHHGTPLKKMGLDLRDSPFSGPRTNFRQLMRRCERWDFSISANPFSTEVWERVYPTEFETLEVGYPRNDVLVNATDEDVRRCREKLGIRPGQKAVLYAPTHREYNQGFVPVLDLAHVADELGSDYVIMARIHYFYDTDEHVQDLHRAGRILDVAQHPSIEELCLASDALVTDYSSIMFDYAVLDRPIVVYAPDWEVYRAMRGSYFDLMSEPPGAVARTEDELLRVFQSGADSDAEATRMRKAFRDRFCSLEDGHAAERVVRRLFLDASRAEGGTSAA